MYIWRQKFFCREFIIRAVMCSIGVFFLGIGVGCLRYADLGLDPFMSLTTGIFLTVFNPLGLSFGTAYLIFCFTVLLFSVIFDRTKIGPGTLINMTIPGYVSDLVLFLFNINPLTGVASWLLRITGMLAGVFFIGFGSGIYLNTNIGTSSYDATALIITEKLKNPYRYRWIRICTDLACTAAGFLMGSIPGIGTLVMTLFTGPLISFMRMRVLVWGKRVQLVTWI
jgi:uncharacterized membrane protein YczE